MGESITEGTVARWLKSVGDTVREGEGLVEVSTDKVDAEVPAPASGRLRAIIAQTGQTVTVGAPLAEIEVGADGGGTPAAHEEAAQPKAAARPKVAEQPKPDSGGVQATEGAELLARARGVDLAQLRGTGDGGQIRRRDVARAIEERERGRPEAAAGKPAEPLAAAPEDVAKPAPAQPA